jgi:hypothetical protein
VIVNVTLPPLAGITDRVLGKKVNGKFTTILYGCVTVCGGELLSLTVTLKLKVPVPAGVPVIAPVLEFRDSPPGNPVETLNVNGFEPPEAVREVALTGYAVPTKAVFVKTGDAGGTGLNVSDPGPPLWVTITRCV